MKYPFYLTLSLIALCTACSNDVEKDIILKSASNTISFNASAPGVTRAQDLNTGNLAEISASAIWRNSATQATYFSQVPFVRNGQAFVSGAPYYWPEEGTLDFHAYAPSGNSQAAYDATNKKFTVTPDGSDDSTSQVDLIYANTNGRTRAHMVSSGSVKGIPLNFRHTESKVSVKVKNSSTTMRFYVSGYKLAYVSKSGVFEYGKSGAYDNGTIGPGTLRYADWTPSEASVTDTYIQSLSNVCVNPGSDASLLTATGHDWILVPQTHDMASSYTGTDALTPANGSYLSFDVEIRNNDDNVVEGRNGHVIYSGWAMWPVSLNLAPGYHYTYTVDLSGGGYYETNHTDINPGKPDLDPILGDAVIRFDLEVKPWIHQDVSGVTVR